MSDVECPVTQPSTRLRRVLLVCTAALVVSLGVAVTFRMTGGHKVDEVAWRADVEEARGSPVADWATYRGVWLDECGESGTQFSFFVASQLDHGATADFVRLNVSHACPDRLSDVEHVMGSISSVENACRMTPSDRTEEQDRLARAMGC